MPNKEKEKLVPNLRFKGFTDDWIQYKLQDIANRVTRKNEKQVANIPLTISDKFGLIDQREYFTKKIASKNMSHYILLKKGEFAYNKSYSKRNLFGTIARLDNYDMGALSTLYIAFEVENADSTFIQKYYESDKWHYGISKIANEGARNHGLLNISTQDFFNTRIKIPYNLDEQTKIGITLEKLDKIITLEQEKNDHIKLIKKSILQNIFTEKEKGFTSLRFNSFNENWVERKLGDLLKYEQPTKYIVKTAEYSDKYDIPVLTAGKTFLLGYTNETTGIYDKGEVILFDDFTTATQFVDFKFKVKSSAMKLLTPIDNNDINFLFEVLNVIQYPHEDHKRYWISEFSTLKIMIPKSKKEQQQIGSLLKQIDIIMKKSQSKINMYLRIKASLLDTLFV